MKKIALLSMLLIMANVARLFMNTQYYAVLSLVDTKELPGARHWILCQMYHSRLHRPNVRCFALL